MNATLESEEIETHSGLKPIVELDNVWVSKSLQHVQLIVHHLLIALDVLL